MYNKQFIEFLRDDTDYTADIVLNPMVSISGEIIREWNPVVSAPTDPSKEDETRHPYQWVVAVHTIVCGRAKLYHRTKCHDLGEAFKIARNRMIQASN